MGSIFVSEKYTNELIKLSYIKRQNKIKLATHKKGKIIDLFRVDSVLTWLATANHSAIT